MVNPYNVSGNSHPGSGYMESGAKEQLFFDMAKYSVQNQTDTPRIFRPVPLKPSPPQRPKSHLYAFMLKNEARAWTFKTVALTLQPYKNKHFTKMKRITCYVLALCALPMLLTSCAQTKEFTESNINGEWNIVSADGFNAADEETMDAPFLGFNTAEKRLYGSTGCNNVMGSIKTDSLSQGRLSFSPVAMTRRYCPNDQLERHISGMFDKVRKLRMKGSKLMLTDEDGKVLITLSRRSTQAQ